MKETMERIIEVKGHNNERLDIDYDRAGKKGK